MNSTVTATGMVVKAKAEKGLLINEVSGVDSATWDEEATANNLPGTALYPTSTKDTITWLHANSKTSSNEAGAAASAVDDNLSSSGYTTLTLKDSTASTATGGTAASYSIKYTDAAGGTEDSYDNTDNAYAVKYTYYLKASNDSKVTLGTSANNENVAIKSVEVTAAGAGDSGAAVSTELNKAIRVGIDIGNKFYIYAPVSGATGTYYVYNGSNTSGANAQVKPFGSSTYAYTALSELPNIKTTGTPVHVYIWFEGEDEACKSDNLTATLDNLTATVTFELVTLSTENVTAIAGYANTNAYASQQSGGNG